MSTHTNTILHYMITSQVLIQLFGLQSREKRMKYQLIGTWQREEDFLILDKNLSTPELTQAFWIAVQKIKVLTPSLLVKGTCFYTKQIKGSFFLQKREWNSQCTLILQHPKSICSGLAGLCIFLNCDRLFIRLLFITITAIFRHTIQYRINKSASLLCPVTYIEKGISKGFAA